MLTAVSNPSLTRRQMVTAETPSSLATAFAARKPGVVNVWPLLLGAGFVGCGALLFLGVSIDAKKYASVRLQ